jgi:hypothetical protein
MTKHVFRIPKLAVLVLAVAACDRARSDDPSMMPDAQIEVRTSFVRDVWPILARPDCTRCHSNELRGDFRTPETAYAALTDQRRQVGHICNADETPILPVVEPGKPQASGLFRLIAVGYHKCERRYGMPKNEPRGLLQDFDPQAVATIARWIAEGASRD